MEVTAFAPPAEAHARLAFALTQIRKYLIPDSNDQIRQEQMREMELMTGAGLVEGGVTAGESVSHSLQQQNSDIVLQQHNPLPLLSPQTITFPRPLTQQGAGQVFPSLLTPGNDNGIVSASFLSGSDNGSFEISSQENVSKDGQ